LVQLLLFSLNAEPSLARRVQLHAASGVKENPLEPGSLSKVSAATANATKPGSLVESSGTEAAAYAQAILEAIRSDEREDVAWCGWGYSTTLRWYHFEMDIVGEKPNEVRHFAVELVRAPLAPRLVMHAGMTWGVRMSDDARFPLDWVLEPIPGAPSGYSIGIDFLYEVEHLRSIKSDDAPNSLEILFVNGTSITLTGGLYYPDKLVLAALGRVQDEEAGEEVEEETDDAASRMKKAASEGGQVALSKIVEHSKEFAKKGALGGVAVGMGLTFTWASAIMLINSALTEATALMGVNVAVNVGQLSIAQMFSYATCAGGLGLAGGVGLGLGVGLVAGIPLGVAAVISHWVKMQKEMQLSASDKIFAKLDCHRHFVRCGTDGDLLVPEGKTCPELPK